MLPESTECLGLGLASVDSFVLAPADNSAWESAWVLADNSA